MKVLKIFIFILFLATSVNILMDVLLGLTFFHSLFYLLNPFWIMDGGEYVMLAFLLLLIIGHQVFIIMKDRAKKQNDST